VESGVALVACDMLNAAPLMLHTYAAAAQDEGRAIGARTKAARAAARARGARLERATPAREAA
jgi:DNA invertase Pin-like site-specific DNA recombinase